MEGAQWPQCRRSVLGDHESDCTGWGRGFRERFKQGAEGSLTEGKRPIINAQALSLMKPTAFLLNAERVGQIAGAALHMLSADPPPAHHPLLHEERV